MTQREALEILKTGVNVFLTGAAGSGKTHVLRGYLDYLKAHNIQVGITASTGIAATHMNGVTIHSWSGIGIKDSLNEWDIEEIAGRGKVAKKIKSAKVLVIDEISMLHHYRLDMVDAVLKNIRDSREPFGGIQIVVCGDFFQLPPIVRAPVTIDSGQDILFAEPEMRETQFAYHARSWKEADFVTCYLDEQHRQTDKQYLSILNAVRDGTVTEETVSLLHTRKITIQGKERVRVTRLYSHNVNVHFENERELNKLSGKVFVYDMVSHGNKRLVEGLKKNCLAPEKLKLKVGAKVMFVKNNYDKGYMNGTMGIVKSCSAFDIFVTTKDGTVRVEKDSWGIYDEYGKSLAEIVQYPLRLAWAITIHKSQGMSLDEAEIDLSQSFEKGMGYVALSRLKSLSGLHLIGLNDMALTVHEEALEYDKHFREESARWSEWLAEMDKGKIVKIQGDFLKGKRGLQ